MTDLGLASLDRALTPTSSVCSYGDVGLIDRSVKLGGELGSRGLTAVTGPKWPSLLAAGCLCCGWEVRRTGDTGPPRVASRLRQCCGWRSQDSHVEGGDFAWGQGSEEPREKEPAVELEPLEQSLGLPAVAVSQAPAATCSGSSVLAAGTLALPAPGLKPRFLCPLATASHSSTCFP